MIRTLVVALIVLLAGCAQPEVEPSEEFDPELGVGPTVREAEPSPATSPAGPAPGEGTIAGSPPSDAASPSTAPTTPTPSPAVVDSPAPAPSQAPDSHATPTGAGEPVLLLSVDDRAGDHGARGPDWADLRSLELVEVGNDLRVTVRLDGEVPETPPAGEVPLVGVDIGDDGYQLFVEGGGESWAAYLDTPEGFVAYPGTFELAGRALVLQVPFNAVGSPTRAPVRAFVEWSRDSGTLGVLNPTSEDRLDGQPHTFDRNP